LRVLAETGVEAVSYATGNAACLSTSRTRFGESWPPACAAVLNFAWISSDKEHDTRKTGWFSAARTRPGWSTPPDWH
jgi:hypothetical protein